MKKKDKEKGRYLHYAGLEEWDSDILGDMTYRSENMSIQYRSLK